VKGGGVSFPKGEKLFRQEKWDKQLQETKDIVKTTGLWPDQGCLTSVAELEVLISELLQRKLYL